MAEYKSFTYEILDENHEDHGDARLAACKCCRFNRGTDLPIPKTHAIEDTTRYARSFSSSILKNWSRLNAILKRFERTIQKRWMKKGLKQRRELLLKAWPAISATHRPDFANFRDMKRKTPRSRTCHSEAFLWPYINLEDLQQRELLLLFLNSRGRNLPESFRLADLKAAHLGEGWIPSLDFVDALMFRVFDNEGRQCMLFQNKHSPAGYGRVIDRTSANLKTSQLKYLFRASEGLLLLEIQDRIYQFLLNCTVLILHDIDPKMFLVAPHQPSPAMSGVVKANQWPSLSNYALEAAYRVPQQLNLERMKVLVGARRSLAEDHIWLLREDPAYFMDNVREWKEHGPCGSVSSCKCNDCWNREATSMVTNAFINLVCWCDLHDKLCEMPTIDAQLRRANERKVRLRAVDENRWTAVMEILYNMQQYPLLMLQDGVPLSPRLRHRYCWVGDEKAGDWEMRSKSSSDTERRVDQLFSSLSRPSQRALHGINGLIQEVQYMLETDANASQYFDSWIMGQFSDLALLSELSRSIDALAPWFDENKAGLLVNLPSVVSQTEEIRFITTELVDGVKKTRDDLLWEPKKKEAFDYPADKRPTKDNVEQMIKAEHNLDQFWWSLEISFSDLTGIELGEVLQERTSPPRELYRTPKWKEPIQLPTPEATPPKPLTEVSPNVQRCIDTSASPRKKSFDSTRVKDKIKTRGKPAGPDPRQTPAAPVEPQLPKEKVQICKKAYKVFLALLPSSNAVVQQRCEIAWDELLYAMDVVGLEPEKLYGSVWIFKPLSKEERGPRHVDVDRSIQFHEPKEVRRGAKVPRPMVRTFGRRLRHAFGWGDAVDLFECE